MFSEKKQQKICGFLDGAFIHIIQTFKRHYYKWAVMFILYAQLIHIQDTYIESIIVFCVFSNISDGKN